MGNDVIDTSFILTTAGLLRRGGKQLKARWRLTDYTRQKETEPSRWLRPYRCCGEKPRSATFFFRVDF